MKTLLLSGNLRRRAQSGELPLRQAEELFALDYSADRITGENNYQISVASSDQDGSLIQKIRNNSVPLRNVTNRARGDELSGSGLLWRCPACAGYTVPGAKKKGGGYHDKECPHCGLMLSQTTISIEHLVSDVPGGAYRTPFIDGKVFNHRYINPVRRYIRTDLTPLSPGFKDSAIFLGPKILIRQAGTGITATLVRDDARCPQSIYIYRVNERGQRAGLNLEVLLACLNSRIFSYVVLKTFGEVDPARAFNKLTHERLSELPVINGGNLADKERDSIVQLVYRMLDGDELGGPSDFQIEQLLAKAWGVSPAHLAYINSTFSLIPESQAVKDLFPDGPPDLQPFPAQIDSGGCQSEESEP